MTKTSLALTLGALGSVLFGLTEGCADKTTNVDTGGHLLPPSSEGGLESGVPIDTSRTPLGKACLADRDCGGSLKCLTSDSTALAGVGIPNGVCTADCSSDPAVCQDTIDPNSVCVGFGSLTGGPAYCMQGCQIGAPPTGQQKCHNRADVACDDTGSSIPGLGFCSPQCRNDADCGARRCDLGTGFCKDAADILGTLPIGSNCQVGLKRSPCQGFCIAARPTDGGTAPGFCTGLCAVGQIGCGADPSSGAPPDAACLFVPSQASADGDLGFCGQLCDCNDDCRTDGRVCRPFGTAERSAYGREGYCGGPTDSTTGKPAENLACASTRDAGPVRTDAGQAADATTPSIDATASVDAGPDAP